MSPPCFAALVALTLPDTSMTAFATSVFDTEAMKAVPAAVFRRVAALTPDYAPAHSNLGNILFEMGKLDEAEASYRQALAL